MCRALAVVLVGLAVGAPSAAVAAPSCKAPRVLIVLDRSSSMITGLVGTDTKWEIAKAALQQVVNKYKATIEFGLMVFPEPNQCGPGTVKVPIGPSTATAIMNELATPPPSAGNWTPMAQSLDAAAKVSGLLDSSYNNNVLLITDGWQWCDPYDAATRFLPVNSTTNLTTLGIATYVVGFGDSVDPLTLNKMAAAAKTKVNSTCDPNNDQYSTTYDPTKNCYYQADNSATLLAALQKIVGLVTAEKCDNIDNDCNGLVDDGLSRACSSACGAGTETCTAGVWGNCNAPQPQPEICDGKDNNCDGTTDEGCACKEGESRPCGTTKGQCKAGTQTCNGGKWGTCNGEVKPSTEVCDGKDNNCDGVTDENLSRACLTTCGQGTETCGGGKWGNCTAPQPSKEICDGLDNDCDGVIDGPNASCPEGQVCLSGSCQAPRGNGNAAGSGSCDCQIGGGPAPLPLLVLLVLGAAVLVLRRRR
jgi:MYXO-CTERM domain-containing protein